MKITRFAPYEGELEGIVVFDKNEYYESEDKEDEGEEEH